MANRFSVDAVFRVIDRMTAPISRMKRGLSGFARGAAREFKALSRSLDTTVKKVNQVAKASLRLATVGIGTLAGAVGLLIREFSKVENAEAAFTPLLGGAEKAKQMVASLNETAASTPFQFETLARASKTLLGFGAATQEDLIPMLRMLGDTAGGSAERLDRIALAFGQIKAGGRATMQDINQLVNNGIPILGELAEMWGTNVANARAMVSQGRATAKDVEKAFQKMTTSGGKFFNGMELASKTVTGLFSTLKDNVSLTAAAVGEELSPFVKDYIKQAIDATKKMRDWVTENKELIGLKIGQTVRFITENFGNLVKVIKGLAQLYVTLISLNIIMKTVMIASAAATLAWNFALGVMNGLLMKNIVFQNASKATIIGWAIAMGIAKTAVLAYNVVMGVASVATRAFSLALMTNPIGAIITGVALLIAGLILLVLKFDEVKMAVTDAMETVANKIKGAADIIKKPLEVVAAPFRNIFEGAKGIISSAGEIFGGDEAAGAGATPDVVSPQERVAQTIEERRETTTAEVVIKDESGKAELQKQATGKAASISLLQSASDT